MVTQVQLGSFFDLNGRTVIGGLGGSGLDTESLIKTLTEAKGAAAVQYQDKVDLNDKQSAAFSTFQSLLTTFKSAADALRNPPGVGNDADNAFKYTTTSIASNTIIPGGTYLSAISTPGATLQSYTVSEITSLASAAHQTSGTFTLASVSDSAVAASSTPGLFTAGTFTVNGQSITLNTGDTLGTVAAKFNAVSENSGVSASVIQVDSTHFKLFFTATETGTDQNFDLTDAGTVTDAGGVLSNIGLGAAVAGTNAVFKVNGISLTRQSNSVDDAIGGVTLNLLSQTPDAGTQLTLSVQPDTTIVQNSIVNFVKAYNAIKTFATTQTQLNTDGTYAETSYLANNATFRSIMNDLMTQVSSEVAGITNGNPKNLADIGITFTTQPASGDNPKVENILNVNDNALQAALLSNFSGVNKLFGAHLNSNNPSLALVSTSNNLGVSSFSLSLNPTANTFRATYDDGSGPVTVNLTATSLGASGGYSLEGPADTPLAGLKLVYASSATASINVTLTNGLASQMYNTSDASLTGTNGLVPKELQLIKDNTTQLNKNIAEVNDQVAQYKEQLIAQFAALEKAISSVNSLLNSLAANDNARLAASSFS